MVIFGLDEHVFQLAFAPQDELCDTNVDALLSEYVFGPLGEIAGSSEYDPIKAVSLLGRYLIEIGHELLRRYRLLPLTLDEPLPVICLGCHILIVLIIRRIAILF